ncbi:unnamed protein product [Cutaneotrichosporon oleaginosum]
MSLAQGEEGPGVPRGGRRAQLVEFLLVFAVAAQLILASVTRSRSHLCHRSHRLIALRVACSTQGDTPLPPQPIPRSARSHNVLARPLHLLSSFPSPSPPSTPDEMGLSLSRIYTSLSSLAFWGKDKEVRILMVGLDSAGKVRQHATLGFGAGFVIGRAAGSAPSCGSAHTRQQSSIASRLEKSYLPSPTVSYKNINFQVWDLGGQSSIRPYWRCYYANTQAIIYVIDSADTARLPTSRSELLTMLAEEELKNVPVLVFANKQDMAGALSPAEISDKLGLAGQEKGREWSVRGSCATKGEGLEEGLDW